MRRIVGPHWIKHSHLFDPDEYCLVGITVRNQGIRRFCAHNMCLVAFQLALRAAVYVYATYNELMKNGWRMMEIDEMDMLGFLRLRAWDARREQEKKKPRQRFIDEVWPGMKPR